MCLKRHQPAMSIDEQIQNLRELGLIIPDEDHARSMLGDVSYFRLIKAFSLGLKQKNSAYNKGITFEMIETYVAGSQTTFRKSTECWATMTLQTLWMQSITLIS